LHQYDHEERSHVSLGEQTPVACATADLRPNPPFQPTPLRVAKIVGILASSFVLTALPTYHGGAAEWQSVSPLNYGRGTLTASIVLTVTGIFASVHDSVHLSEIGQT
jgi:hypothetical protein